MTFHLNIYQNEPHLILGAELRCSGMVSMFL